MFFALDDSERDRFWDHIIGGVSVASFTSVSRDKCPDLCSTTNNNLGLMKIATPNKLFYNKKNKIKRQINKWKRNNRNTNPNILQQKSNDKIPAVIYSWKTENERNNDSPIGHCECIGVLESVKINFGSFSGFLI